MRFESKRGKLFKSAQQTHVLYRNRLVVVRRNTTTPQISRASFRRTSVTQLPKCRVPVCNLKNKLVSRFVVDQSTPRELHDRFGSVGLTGGLIKGFFFLAKPAAADCSDMWRAG